MKRIITIVVLAMMLLPITAMVQADRMCMMSHDNGWICDDANGKDTEVRSLVYKIYSLSMEVDQLKEEQRAWINAISSCERKLNKEATK